jgi:hypothetical protein
MPPTGRPRINEVPELSALLNAARSRAIAEFNGRGADPKTLRDFAARIKEHILADADAGKWTVLGIHARGALVGIAVRATAVAGLVGGTRVQVEYDFARTTVPALLARDKGPPVSA